MCLIAFAYKVHPEYPLILAANRDEFLDRLSDPARFWPSEPHVLAGRDRKAGGTWLGVTTRGRFAAVTNYRDLRRPPVVGGPSRGLLVRKAMDADFVPEDTSNYEGFNLLYGQVDALRYHSNITGVDEAVSPGVHGLSNHLLDTPWPKVQRAKQELTRLIASNAISSEGLFELLADRSVAPDEQLPDTGLDLQRERALSAILITMAGYGTRCSTVLFVGRTGQVSFFERTIDPPGQVEFAFRTP